MIELRHPNDSYALVNPAGAYVESWADANGAELLFARRDMPNGKNRGGIPLCAPIFGPGETVGLSQHGFARNCTWTVHTQTESRVTLSLDDPAAQVESLPPVYAGCSMDLAIELEENSLRETLTIRNIGVESFTLNPAFHPYFPITDGQSATDARVTIDGQTYQCSAEELLATRKIDSIAAAAQLQLGQRAWSIAGDGLPLFALWSESDTDFLCVEPTESGYLTDNPASELQPSQTKTVAMTISFRPTA
ncbi:hypothetical protein CSA80_02740 [Candidatus Saccharibacteria bacterium]|nr:MAG: hypothetical protein CR973_02855 [Candidatus Saccharibacteria bacterium]PID99008.1 MAG: hypothetical protein CSA80_02740 [Candidatus Saccharibacteria bacterium]